MTHRSSPGSIRASNIVSGMPGDNTEAMRSTRGLPTYPQLPIMSKLFFMSRFRVEVSTIRISVSCAELSRAVPSCPELSGAVPSCPNPSRASE